MTADADVQDSLYWTPSTRTVASSGRLRGAVWMTVVSSSVVR